jgi:hypothetical protein
MSECRRERRGRQRIYSGESVRNLVGMWRIAGRICGKRLHPFLPELVAALERHGELVMDDETRQQLLQMSASTIDRQVAPFRQERGRNMARPGTLLKATIPIRFFQPGMMLQSKTRCGSKIHKRYDRAQTPHQRAVASEQLPAKNKLSLNHTFLQLNPAKLRADLDANLRRLWQLPR